jgi:hypothetical protein
MKNVIKQTQGNRKLKQYLEELRRNKHFIADLKSLRNPKIKDKIKIYHRIAEKYGIDMDTLISLYGLQENEEMIWGDASDLCVILDNCDNFEDVDAIEDNYCYPRNTKTPSQDMFIRAYPVSINLHKLASKRDVLDFIEKNWDLIESYFELSRNKKHRIRSRKNLNRDNFIWENRNVGANEIKRLLDEKFPENGLVYFDIHKIISNERKRRQKKIDI